MMLKSSLVLGVFWCGLAGSVLPCPGQATGSTKTAPPAGSPYSSEETPTAAPGLAQHEADLRTALASQPESASLLYALALVQRQENKPSESLSTYTQAAKLRKPTPLELRSAALDYVLLSDYDDATRWLETAASMAPTDADILYALGRCYYSKNRFADAEKMYERVLTLQPKNLKAEENLGLVYDATNRTQQAETALRQAANWADAHGTDEWPFLDLGSFLLDHDRADDALEPLRIAESIRPDSAAAHEKLGRALLGVQDSKTGINELQVAEKIDPREPRIHYELGRALRQAGDVEQAKKEFALSQQLYSSHSEE